MPEVCLSQKWGSYPTAKEQRGFSLNILLDLPGPCFSEPLPSGLWAAEPRVYKYPPALPLSHPRTWCYCLILKRVLPRGLVLGNSIRSTTKDFHGPLWEGGTAMQLQVRPVGIFFLHWVIATGSVLCCTWCTKICAVPILWSYLWEVLCSWPSQLAGPAAADTVNEMLKDLAGCIVFEFNRTQPHAQGSWGKRGHVSRQLCLSQSPAKFWKRKWCKD